MRKRTSKLLSKPSANKLLAILLTTLVFLSGCWDNVELENRGFVISLGIDKAMETGSFSVTLEIPREINDKASDGKKLIKTSQGATLTLAMANVDTYTSKTMYYGHTKLAVFGENALNDESIVKESIDALLRSRDISRKLIILSSKTDANAVISLETEDEATMGAYISNFYQKNNDSINYRLDLDTLESSLTQYGFAIIPEINIEDEQAKMGGAAVLKNYTLTGWLNESDMRGFLWIKSEGSGARILGEHNSTPATFNVDKEKTTLDFYEKDGVVVARYTINITGSIEEFADLNKYQFDEVMALSQSFENVITEEIKQSHTILYNEYEIDGFNLISDLEKKNNTLYTKYINQLGPHGQNIVIQPEITVEINSLGAIK